MHQTSPAVCRTTLTDKLVAWVGVLTIILFAGVGTIVWLIPDVVPLAVAPPPAEPPKGAEYFEIAKSIADGRGFSSPFQVPSGPTAWMPPGLPLMLSVLYVACGKNELLYAILYQILNTGCVIGVWVLLLRITPSLGLSRIVTACGFFVSLFSQWKDVFVSTHDGPVLMFLATSLVTMMIGMSDSAIAISRRSSTVWGVLGGILSLFSPALLLGWLACSAILFWRHFPKAIFAIAIALVIQSPWLVRNYFCFEEFVPIKSNAAFESAQARLTASGVLGPSAFASHPYLDRYQAQRHAEMGEMAFIRARSEEMLRETHGSQHRLAQISNRFLAYTFLYSSWHASDWERIAYMCPALFLVAFFCFGSEKRRAIALVLGLFCAYGLPYVLFSYYERYSVPMIAVRGLSISLGIQATFTWLGRKQNSPARVIAMEWACLIPVLLAFQLLCYWFRASTSVTVDETCYLACAQNSLASGRLHEAIAHLGIAPLPIIVEYLPFVREAQRENVWMGQVMDRPWIETSRVATSCIVGSCIPLLLYAATRRLDRIVAWTIIGFTLLSPSVIAHSSIAATDGLTVVAWLGTALAIASFWANPAIFRGLLVGATMGIAIATKYSSLIFLVVFVIAFVAAYCPIIFARPRTFRPLLTSLSVLCIVLTCCAVVTWGLHGFQLVWYEGYHLPFPMVGILNQIAHNSRGHATMLLGNVSPTGFWYYFPIVLSMKATPVELLLLPLGLGIGVYTWKTHNWTTGDRLVPTLSLAVLCGVLFFISSRVQIGFRYILPLCVLGFFGLQVFIANRLSQCTSKPVLRSIFALGLFVQLTTVVSTSPKYLSYVNGLWGGSSNGFRLMADSNVDWGQDLPSLRNEIEALDSTRVAISYFGTAQPAAYGIAATMVAPSTVAAELQDFDYFAISINHLYGLRALSPETGTVQRELLDTKPFARAGDSILIFRLKPLKLSVRNQDHDPSPSTL